MRGSRKKKKRQRKKSREVGGEGGRRRRRTVCSHLWFHKAREVCSDGYLHPEDEPQGPPPPLPSPTPKDLRGYQNIQMTQLKCFFANGGLIFLKMFGSFVKLDLSEAGWFDEGLARVDNAISHADKAGRINQ